MSLSLFRSAIDAMPQWHKQPLLLTEEGLQNPHKVLNAFFDCYDLPNLRYCLHEWLSESMRTDEVLIMDFLSLHDNIIQLAEAAWLIQQKTKKDKKGNKVNRKRSNKKHNKTKQA